MSAFSIPPCVSSTLRSALQVSCLQGSLSGLLLSLYRIYAVYAHEKPTCLTHCVFKYRSAKSICLTWLCLE